MWGGSDEPEAIRTIHAALDHGITLIDTAPVYGFGRSEEIVGRALAEGAKRASVLIATKAGLGWTAAGPFRDARSERIKDEIDQSLRRLRTDYIDLYQIHWRPKVMEHTSRGSRLRALNRLLGYAIAESKELRLASAIPSFFGSFAESMGDFAVISARVERR